MPVNAASNPAVGAPFLPPPPPPTQPHDGIPRPPTHSTESDSRQAFFAVGGRPNRRANRQPPSPERDNVVLSLCSFVLQDQHQVCPRKGRCEQACVNGAIVRRCCGCWLRTCCYGRADGADVSEICHFEPTVAELVALALSWLHFRYLSSLLHLG